MRIPFIALPLLVIEIENKNAGAPLPKIPTNKTVNHLLRGIIFRARIANGIEAKHEMLIRKHANSIAVKPSSDFLMRMYEVPQIAVSRPSKIQFWVLWCEGELDNVRISE